MFNVAPVSHGLKGMFHLDFGQWRYNRWLRKHFRPGQVWL